eukprot:TRINITY_DN1352_c0_g1_i2.p1 TRINITY_DN1352_c0_g1~~TRINITY_DN1352_c0_g1_i2.p1  ORF type:complete len:268 (-),score=131.23 TRINITY_DN1352_c0_g1_i2:21-824(-)
MLMNKQQRLGAKRYAYTSDQLRAIRQDLTVQHIDGDFACTVYRTHALLALEHNDTDEFVVCESRLTALGADDVELTALRALLALGRGGASRLAVLSTRVTAAADKENAPAPADALTAATAALIYRPPPTTLLLERLRRRADSAICAASAALAAAALSSSYCSFFAAWSTAPALVHAAGAALHTSMRRDALRQIVTAYSPAVTFEFLGAQLGCASLSELWTFLSTSCTGLVFGSGKETAPSVLQAVDETKLAETLLCTKQSRLFAFVK